MLSLIAAAAMAAIVNAAPAADAGPPVLLGSPHSVPACRTNGRYELADPALFYRQNGRAGVTVLGKLPKANHEKAVLRLVDGCAAPLVVSYEVGR
ncbi:MAG TPA: hypothetical protein VF459_01600 [Caulobacteraceae bacterium]